MNGKAFPSLQAESGLTLPLRAGALAIAAPATPPFLFKKGTPLASVKWSAEAGFGSPIFLLIVEKYGTPQK